MGTGGWREGWGAGVFDRDGLSKLGVTELEPTGGGDTVEGLVLH